MPRGQRLLTLAVAPLFICSIQTGQEPLSRSTGQEPLSRSQVLRASAGPATPGRYGDCGPGALPETGLQGQVSKDDQVSGNSKAGARCNLRLVGQADIGGRGANYQLAWHGDCAYVGMAGQTFQGPGGPRETDHPLSGVAVIDASDARNPRVIRILQSSVGQQQHEAVEVNEHRGMLVVEIGGAMAQWIEIYDVSKDCRHPVFKGRYDSGTPQFHGLRISPDGRTVYATDTTGVASRGDVLHVIDVSDMTNPRLLMTWPPKDAPPADRYAIHDLDVSPSGDRLYLGTIPAGLAGNGLGFTQRVPGTGPTLVVLDVSDVERRAEDPELRVISQLDTFPNFGHTIQPARIAGNPYIFTSGEVPYTGGSRCPWGWGTIVDFGDERRPRPVSELKLEVNDPENCSKVSQDEADYSIHYSGVDDPNNTTKVFYTWYSAGVRVFDVSRPAAPREIAYYKPPPRESTVFKPMAGGGSGWDAQNSFWDSATSVVRYRPRVGQLWFVSVANGFQVLELTTPRKKPRVARGSRCLARRSPTGPRNIGRIRIGFTRRRLLRLPVKPIRKTRRSYRYCVRGSKGRVSAVFSRRGRTMLVATTARTHGNSGVRPGRRAAALRAAYPRRLALGSGVYRASSGSPRLIGASRGRVRFVAVADPRLLGNIRSLRRHLRFGGL